MPASLLVALPFGARRREFAPKTVVAHVQGERDLRTVGARPREPVGQDACRPDAEQDQPRGARIGRQQREDEASCRHDRRRSQPQCGSPGRTLHGGRPPPPFEAGQIFLEFLHAPTGRRFNGGKRLPGAERVADLSQARVLLRGDPGAAVREERLQLTRTAEANLGFRGGGLGDDRPRGRKLRIGPLDPLLDLAGRGSGQFHRSREIAPRGERFGDRSRQPAALGDRVRRPLGELLVQRPRLPQPLRERLRLHALERGRRRLHAAPGVPRRPFQRFDLGAALLEVAMRLAGRVQSLARLRHPPRGRHERFRRRPSRPDAFAEHLLEPLQGGGRRLVHPGRRRRALHVLLQRFGIVPDLEDVRLAHTGRGEKRTAVQTQPPRAVRRPVVQDLARVVPSRDAHIFR